MGAVDSDLASSRPPRLNLVIAGAVGLLAIALMAWDHLWGNEGGSDDSFPVDAATFFLSAGLILVAAVLVFGVTVRRTMRIREKLHRSALIHSGVALVLAPVASWLGFPLVVAGGGIALGVQALPGAHRRLAILAIAVGVLVLAFGIAATAFPADTD